jgi:hypothetical protein
MVPAAERVDAHAEEPGSLSDRVISPRYYLGSLSRSSCREAGNRKRVDEVQDHLRALQRLFRQRLDDAAEGPGAELVDLSVVETTVSKAVEDLERAERELAVAESRS